MLPSGKYLGFQSMFYNFFVNLPPSSEPSQEEYLPDGHYMIASDKAQGMEWPIFHTMAADFIRELKDDINLFITDIRRFSAWSRVNEQCPEEYKNDFAWEIFAPIASSVLNRPYIIQQRFIYISSMLLHQTKVFLDTEAKDHKPLDEFRIDRKHFRKQFKGDDALTNGHKLMSSVLEIAGQDFIESTRHFRNLYHHRIPQEIETGLSPCVNIGEGTGKKEVRKSTLFSGSRRMGTKTIIYDFCVLKPVKVSDILLSLYKQHRVCVKSFYIFWDWISELVERWHSERPTDT